MAKASKKLPRKVAPRRLRLSGPPTAAACEDVVQRLASLHGLPQRQVMDETRKDAHTCGERQDVLAALIATLLSQHTTAKNARAAMDTLWAQFDGDYAAMAQAGAQPIARAIRVGGLSQVKSRRIHAILSEVKLRHGSYSLEHLRELDDEAAKKELTMFAGVGPKTASCVLLFALGRNSFAVDTHVLRLSKRLGWLPANASREQAYLHLDARVPDALKYALHVLMVHHGKCCPDCAAGNRPQRPPEGPCPLVARPPSARAKNKR